VTFAGRAAPVDSASWTDLSVEVTVPDSATSGAVTVITSAGRQLTAVAHVLPHVVFDPATLAWQAAPATFPRAPVGVALAAAQRPVGPDIAVTFYAAGGAEPLGDSLQMIPDSGVYVAHADPGTPISAWVRQRDTTSAFASHVLPQPRAFAAAAAATRYNSHAVVGALYVIGGIDTAGHAQSSVFAAPIDADSVLGPFVSLTSLPVPVAGAIAVVRRGRIYVFGGADSTGHPQTTVLVGRVNSDGSIDGWYQEPGLSAARAYGGGVVRDHRALVFGGRGDSVPPGGGLDTAALPLGSSDTASVSPASGFFTAGWATGRTLLPAGRSQFATLDLSDVILVVGGLYPGAAGNAAETLAAAAAGDSVGDFSGPVGTATIFGQGGGTLVGPAGVSWRDGAGKAHGLVLGGMDLATRLRKAGVWSF